MLAQSEFELVQSESSARHDLHDHQKGGAAVDIDLDELRT